MKLIEHSINMLSETYEGNKDKVFEEASSRDNNLLKSLSVRNQINQWEKLVEICIHFQKCIQISNILPTGESYKSFYEKDEFSSTINETTKELNSLLQNISLLQNLSKSKSGEMINSKKKDNSSKHVKEIGNDLQTNFKNYRQHRNETLQKWYSRAYVTGDISKLNVNKKIEDLMLNKSAVLTRSQTLNPHYLQKILPTLANPNRTEENSEEKIISQNVYDDTDFYLSLLQEVIDFKSSSEDKTFKEKLSVLNMARQKMKRSTGTKATKGRKIRFTVHNKLVNFMPINPSTEYEDDQRNVLFQSLFSS